MGMLKDDAALLALFEQLALAAGAAIMRHYDAGCEVHQKADDTPVTAADRAAVPLTARPPPIWIAGVAPVPERELADAAPVLRRRWWWAG